MSGTTTTIDGEDGDRQPGAEHEFPPEVPELVNPEHFRGVSQADADAYRRHASARALGRAYANQREDASGDVARRQ